MDHSKECISCRHLDWLSGSLWDVLTLTGGYINFSFELGDIVRHPTLGDQDLEVSKLFPKTKHVLLAKTPDGSVYRLYTAELVRVRRPKDEIAKAERETARLAKAEAKKAEMKFIEARRSAFARYLASGGRLTKEGLPDKRVTKLREAKDGRRIIWIGRKN